MKTSVSPVFSFDELPLGLHAHQVATVLTISRTNPYALLHHRDFPTLQIGGRMLVARDKLIQWMDDQVMAQ